MIVFDRLAKGKTVRDCRSGSNGLAWFQRAALLTQSPFFFFHLHQKKLRLAQIIAKYIYQLSSRHDTSISVVRNLSGPFTWRKKWKKTCHKYTPSSNGRC